MRRVTVILTGQDNSKHEFSINAASLFDAAEQAIRQVWKLWWYDPQRLIEVRAGTERWWVDPETVRKKRTR